MNQQLKNKIDSIKRTLKNQNITVNSSQIETKIFHLIGDDLELFTDEIRLQVIEFFKPIENSLTIPQKNEMVTITAESMGIKLATNEVESIAEYLELSSSDLNDSLIQIESAITAFINYKCAINNAKITNMIENIRGTVQESNKQVSGNFNNGIQAIGEDIKQANKDFKSQIAFTLGAFKLPAKS